MWRSKKFLNTAILQTFFFLFVTQNCFAQWFRQNPLSQVNHFYAVDFVSQFISTSGNIHSIFFTDPSNGWIVLYEFVSPLTSPQTYIKKPGTYEVEFSTCHSRKSAVGGRNLSEGIYFYRLEAGDYRSEKKMVLQK